MDLRVERIFFDRASIGLFLSGMMWLVLSCEREPAEVLPVVETTGISDITLSSVTARANLVQAGEKGVSQHGFCWSLAPGPEMKEDSCTQLGPRLETGDFSSDIPGLDQNTSYYIRAYAVNGAGIAYGNELIAKTGRELTVPLVETKPVNIVTENTALAGGVVRDDGGSEITSFGICWATVQNPTIEGSHFTFSEWTSTFSTTLKQLELRTIYYVRAFATNSSGLAYGNEVVFRTNDSPVTDIDGNVYPAVVIGEQIWMARNLEVTHYADGTEVPFTPANEWWDSLRVTEKGYCYYNNSPSNKRNYGALYSWSAAVNGVDDVNPEQEPIQGVCPDGWHLPSDNEWKELEMFLGMSVLEADSTGWRGRVGGKLKATGSRFWLIPNEGATNETRFTALPAGERFPKGDYFNLAYSTTFWTSSNYNRDYAWARALGYYVTTMYRGHNDTKEFGFSVRCVKN